MEQNLGPKKLQRKGDFEKALSYLTQRYIESLSEGDRFLSSHYLDEIAHTIILSYGKDKQGCSFESLRSEVVKTVSNKVKENQREEFEEDLEITLRKRFPERFKEELIENNSEQKYMRLKE